MLSPIDPDNEELLGICRFEKQATAGAKNIIAIPFAYVINQRRWRKITNPFPEIRCWGIDLRSSSEKARCVRRNIPGEGCYGTHDAICCRNLIALHRGPPPWCSRYPYEASNHAQSCANWIYSPKTRKI